MVKQILTGAGFVENKTFKKTRFFNSPRTTHAIYLDSLTRRGADNLNLIKEHFYTIELYYYEPDPDAEERIEAMFDNLGIEYEKQAAYWIQEESFFQVVYTFDYIEK